MDILWITENYPPSRGGMAQSCDRLVHGLRQQGAAIHVIHFTNRREPYRTDRLERGSYTAVPVHENEAHTLNLCWNFLHGSGLPVDRIVVFGGYLPVIAGPVFARWLQKPLVTLLRGNDFDHAIFMPRKRQMLMDCLDASESIGAVTHEMVSKLRAMNSEWRVRHTPNGIALDDWKPLKSEAGFMENWRKEHAGERLVAGMFGHLKEKKGLPVLLKAMEASPKLRENLFLLLAGEVDDAMMTALREQDIQYKLMPFMDRYELIRYYGLCDVVIIPSYYDGMPNVLLEAGALGVPVVGSDTGGIHDVLHPESRNMLFRSGDPDHLRQLILEFLGLSSEEQKARGDLLKKVIETRFTHEKELKEIANLILSPHGTKFIV